jgi:hypothetical protein
MKLVSFLGDVAVKGKFLGRVRAHQAADRLRQGFGYWEADAGGVMRGCAVGCTLEDRFAELGHGAYETDLGIPMVLARLEDGIFESLPKDLALTWPERFLAAIPVGVDLMPAFNGFMHWLLVDATDGVIRFAKTDRVRTAIRNVADLYARRIKGDEPTKEEWRAAADAAYAAAAYAAAAYAAAAYAAAAAAAAAAADAARRSARFSARVKQSEKLLELLTASGGQQ